MWNILSNEEILYYDDEIPTVLYYDIKSTEQSNYRPAWNVDKWDTVEESKSTF